MVGPPQLSRAARITAALAIAISYLALAGAQLLTKRPWVDEAWFTGPGLDLWTRGLFGTLLLDPNGSHLRLYDPNAVLLGIDRFTYWVMPFHLVQLAFWGRILGFSAVAIRVPSLLWGAVAIVSAGAVVRRLFGPGVAPVVAMFVLAIDFGFTNGAADGRMDMTCAALSFGAVAAYLTFRERSLGMAVALSHTLSATAIFTHPNGLFASIALVILTVALDRERVKFRMFLIAAIPYLLFGSVWLYFCLRDPISWHAQLAANAADRASGLRAPWAGMWREANGRFRNHFWPSGGAGKLKIIGLVIYAGSLCLLWRAPRLRRLSGCQLILMLALLQFVFLGIFASMKASYYMVHILPYFACATGIAFAYLWEMGRGARIAAAVALAVFAAVQVATPYHLAFVVRGNQREFKPLIDYLKAEMRPGDLVCGSSELGFGLGFYNPQLVDDVWLGHWSGKRPTVVVVDRWYYAEVMNTAEQRGIPYKGYFRDTLAKFRLIKTLPGYRIYRRDSAEVP